MLVLVDAFTKYCQLCSLKTSIASETIEQFQKFISYFGIPGKIIRDVDRILKALCPNILAFGTEYFYVTPDVHRGNG